MNAQKLAAFILIVGGTLVLAYGGFSYTRDTHTADFGPMHLAAAEKEQVNDSGWASIGAIVIGGMLLLLRTRN